MTQSTDQMLLRSVAELSHIRSRRRRSAAPRARRQRRARPWRPARRTPGPHTADERDQDGVYVTQAPPSSPTAPMSSSVKPYAVKTAGIVCVCHSGALMKASPETLTLSFSSSSEFMVTIY